MNLELPCPVCGGKSHTFDVVDFNKACSDLRGPFSKLSGIPVYYYVCTDCQFCFAPEIAAWDLKVFEDKIYNADYVLVDPDYVESRPQSNAQTLIQLFGMDGSKVRHLDFGGGSGLMSRVLNESGWNSTTYDPFVDRSVDPASLGRFDLITAFEVFEHVPDAVGLIHDLSRLLKPDGIVLFSTLISDGNIVETERLNWWYASPRNGHISLFSKKSLEVLAAKEAFGFGSFSNVFHALFRDVPQWASHLIKKA